MVKIISSQRFGILSDFTSFGNEKRIQNTATTSMILPICISLVKQLIKLDPTLNKRILNEKLEMNTIQSKSMEATSV